MPSITGDRSSCVGIGASRIVRNACRLRAVTLTAATLAACVTAGASLLCDPPAAVAAAGSKASFVPDRIWWVVARKPTLPSRTAKRAAETRAANGEKFNARQLNSNALRFWEVSRCRKDRRHEIVAQVNGK
jgi:hypothetical protein